MRFSPMAVVACLLCAAILAVSFQSPQQSRLNADEITQKKAEINATEQMARDLMTALDNQKALNQKLSEVDNRTIEVIAKLQESVTLLGQSVAMVKDNVPTRDEVTKLVSAKSEAASDDDTTCMQKVEQLQKEISDLKARVDVLELTRATAAKPAASSAAAASSYGTVTVSGPVVVQSSGGSTGSVKSGGSTGSVVRSSGGSTGSLPYGHSYHTDPATGILMQCYRDPMEARYSSTPVSSTVRYSAGQSSPGHWTYPGSIDSHLQSDHGVNVSGLSRSQMLNLHDSIHEGTVTASTVVTSAPVPVASPVCPNGQCPTSRSTSVNQTFFPRLRNRFAN